MCTMITNPVQIEGSGKGKSGWFEIHQANVSYDHPFHSSNEYALNLDFTNETLGPGARVAVELDARSARTLVDAILEVLKQAETGGFLPD